MSNPIVSVSDGKLRGKVLKSPSGKEFYGFLGVPYAKPPIGELRFKPPVSPDPWTGVRDATKEGNKALQFNQGKKKVEGDEDALFLNVYTPQLPSTGTKLLPVMVLIHGGGFISGSGNSDLHGADYLVEKDIVFVTFNYRLGVLGFLCLDIPDAPGNAGLKDQNMVLKWVEENIQQFNGDPSNVTIFGESAGGASVEYHVLSPMSKGLFHKAISQSGSTLNLWARSKDPVKSAYLIAEANGKQFDDVTDFSTYLKDLPASELVMSAIKCGMGLSCVPTVEKGENAFISDDPLTLLKTGQFNKVPYISGAVQREGLFFELIQPGYIEKLANNKELLSNFPHKVEDEAKSALEERLNSTYIYGDQVERDGNEFAIDFLSDAHFIGGIYVASKLISKHVKPVYFYEFTYDGGLNFFKLERGIKKKGACHADEMGYLMRAKLLPENVPAADDLVRKRMTELWTNFAKYGNPTPSMNHVVNTEWLPTTEEDFNYLQIDQNLVLKDKFHPERMAIYEDIYLG